MDTRSFPWSARIALGLWPLLVLALYLPSIRNDFVYDDITLIVKEQPPASAGDLFRAFRERHFPTVPYYRPVTRLTFLLQRRWHGLNPVPYHLANGILAALAAFRLLRVPCFGLSPLAASAGALLWAVHPIMSSAVYPICSGRETLLPAFLTLLAMESWFRQRTLRAALLFILALFAREQALVLPLLFGTADYLRLNDHRNQKTVVSPWKAFAPYGVMALAIIGYLMVRKQLFHGAEFHIALLENPWGPLFSILYALQTFFFPFRMLVYEPPLPLWWSWTRLVPSLIFTAVLIALALRQRTGLHPLLFWTFWFLLLLAPTANILKQETPFDERYLLLPSLAFFAIGASACAALPGPVRTIAVPALVASAAIAWVSITLHRSRYFKDDATFAAHWLHVNPNSHNALLNYAKYQIDAGRYEEARRAAARAVELAPDLEYAWYNLGVTLDRLGRTDQALTAYQRALTLKPIAEAHYNLAVALAANGHTNEAIRHYQAAIVRNPRHSDAHYNLGLLLAENGRLADAIPLFERAAELDPRDGQSLYNLGVALERLGRTPEAVAAYQQALARMPSHPKALFNLALCNYREKQYPACIRLLTRLLAITPDDIEAQALLDAAQRTMQNAAP